jgi:acetyltransferase
MEKLKAIFYPRTVAVVGASREAGSVGQSMLANLLGSRFKGIVFPVNPKADGVLGIKSYPRVSRSG